MAKVEIKTKENEASVDDFINSVKDEKKREDSLTLLKLMKKASKQKPKMWGSSIVGFGNKLYKSPSTNREVDWFTIGFSPRKTSLSIYLISGLRKHESDLKKLGKHKTGVGCLYLNKLEDVDMKILERMINKATK
jgi:Domain of unknown function (DU1801)